MFSRILVGVNGSEHAARALAVAIDLAVAERGRLTLISAVPHPSPWAWGGPISLDDLRRDSARYYEAMLRKAAEAVRRRCRRLSSYATAGQPTACSRSSDGITTT
jgi:nucleotide-binding universal stress UspA family protein